MTRVGFIKAGAVKVGAMKAGAVPLRQGLKSLATDCDPSGGAKTAVPPGTTARSQGFQSLAVGRGLDIHKTAFRRQP